MTNITPEQVTLARDIIEFELNSAYSWLSEFGYIPEIILDTSQPGVVVPEYLKRSRWLTLNISLASTQNLRFTNGKITFNTRFNQVPASCEIPYTALVAITGREIKDFYTRPFHPPSVAALRAHYDGDKASPQEPTAMPADAPETNQTPAQETTPIAVDSKPSEAPSTGDNKVTSLAAFRDRSKKK